MTQMQKALKKLLQTYIKNTLHNAQSFNLCCLQFFNFDLKISASHVSKIRETS